MNELNAIYLTAAIAFLVAVLFDLWSRTHRIKKHHRENPISDRMEKALHYFKDQKNNKKITNDIYQELTGVSDSTAARDLDKLVELDLLERKGKTSGIYYTLRNA